MRRTFIPASVAITLVMFAATANCAWWQSTGETDVVDCTVGDLGDLEGLVDALFPVGTPVNWTKAGIFLAGFGTDVGGCLFADLLDREDNSTPLVTASDAGTPAVATSDAGTPVNVATRANALVTSVGDSRAAFATFRSKLNVKKTYRTRHGRY